MVIKTFTKGVFYTIICVGLLGLLSGLALTGADIVNPWTSQAKAAQTEMQTAYVAEKNTIDLAYYRQVRAQEAQAQVTKTNDDLNYHQRMNEVKLNLVDWGGKVAIGLIAYTIVLSVFLVFWHRFHQMIAHRETALQTKLRLTQAYLQPKSGVMQNGNGNGHIPFHHSPQHPKIYQNAQTHDTVSN